MGFVKYPPTHFSLFLCKVRCTCSVAMQPLVVWLLMLLALVVMVAQLTRACGTTSCTVASTS